MGGIVSYCQPMMEAGIQYGLALGIFIGLALGAVIAGTAFAIFGRKPT